MRRIQSLVFIVSLSAASQVLAAAGTKYPGLNFIDPVAIERGKTTTVLVDTNGDIKGAYKALVEGAGVAARILARDAKLPAGQVRVEFVVAADAAIGPREIRIADKACITTAGTVYITAMPVVRALETNDRPEKSQTIEFPKVICGRLQREVDEDWFHFSAKKGEQFNFTVLGARLHDTMHKIGRFIPHLDAMLLVTDADGNELASNDDFYFADPQLSFFAPRAGEYRLRLSEATYKGNPFYTYALFCTRGPLALQARPFGLGSGTTAKRHLLGPGIAEQTFADVTMPAGLAAGSVVWVQPKLTSGWSQELPVVACELPSVDELEPNDSTAKAQRLKLNSAVSGTIGRSGDVDYFAFEAEKGVEYDFEIFARRLFTPLDSEIAVVNAKGNRLAESDDAKPFAAPPTKDSFLTWKAPASGTYWLKVSDKLGRGGPEYGYQLGFQRGRPDFELSCDPIYSMIGPGSRSPIYVRIDRKHGFDAAVKLSVRGLPKGVKAYIDDLRSPMQDALIVLEAGSDAPIDAANLDIVGEAEIKRDGKTEKLQHKAVPLHEIYQAQRRAGRTLAIAVTEPSDIQVETPVKEIVLKPGQSKEIPVTIKRAAKYKKGGVTLWENWRFERRIFGNSLPPGVTADAAKSKLALNGSDTQGKVTLTAAADAPNSGPVQTAVIAQIGIEFSVFVPYCTAPISVRVQK